MAASSSNCMSTSGGSNQPKASYSSTCACESMMCTDLRLASSSTLWASPVGAEYRLCVRRAVLPFYYLSPPCILTDLTSHSTIFSSLHSLSLASTSSFTPTLNNFAVYQKQSATSGNAEISHHPAYLVEPRWFLKNL